MRLPAVVLVCVLAGCSLAPTPRGTAPATPTEEPRADSKSAPAESAAPPESASDLLQCTAAPSSVGARDQELAYLGSGETPDAALDAFLAVTPFVIPVNEYRPIARSGDRHAYGYVVDGEVKVVIVVSSRFAPLIGTAYTVEELRTCPESEFGSEAVFLGARRIWTHDMTGQILTDIVGPGHCGWQSARMLHVELPGSIRQYVRDPEGVFDDAGLLDTYAEGVQLPDDAAFSGYRTADGQELWFTQTDAAAYVVTVDGIERWPRAEEPIGCA